MCFRFLSEESVILFLEMQVVVLLEDMTPRIKDVPRHIKQGPNGTWGQQGERTAASLPVLRRGTI